MPGIHDRIIKQFDRSAPGQYDSGARVQPRMADALSASIARQLADLRTEQAGSPLQVLEIGCGTGTFTASLARMLPTSRITALDISAAMLKSAQHKLAVQFPEALDSGRVRFIEADAEHWVHLQQRRLHLQDAGSAEDTVSNPDQWAGPYSLIASNACFQWFLQPEQTMAALHSLLRKGGILAFTTFGPGTMRELHASFREAYRRMGRPYRHHGLSFRTFEQWRHMLRHAGFQLVDAVSREELETHRSPRDFLHSVKAIGAGATEAGSRTDALGSDAGAGEHRHAAVADVLGIQRRLFREMFQAYESQFLAVNGEGIVATYETMTFVAVRRT